MPAQTLRQYQLNGRRQILDGFLAGALRQLVVAPTGSGKTSVFCYLTEELRVPVLILVHRRELAKQAANRLREFGVDFGLIMRGEPPQPSKRVQIASKDTLVHRPRETWPKAKVIICDEAHLSTAATWRKILEHYPHARVLGFTASPWRMSGKPLAGAYDRVIVVATPRELREQGHLSDYVGFSYKAPDLDGIDTVGEDYDQQQAAAAMSAITGDIVGQWLAHASQLSTIVFACTVEHSQELTAKFKAAGVTAEHLDGTTPQFQRDAILKRVESGATRVLCNVNVVVEGLDIPRVKCCVLARPTKSLARYIQQVGRPRRPWRDPKTGQLVTTRIHDHAFCITQHGLPDADRDYSLHAKPEKPPALMRCSKCFANYEGGRTCPACGVTAEAKPQGEREVKEVDAEQFEFSSEEAEALAAIDAATAALPEAWKPPTRVRWDAVGRVVEGVYEGSKDEETSYGKRLQHLVRGPKRTYSLPGAKHLNELLRRVKVGAHVIVKFAGHAGDGRGMHRFELEARDA
jgi:DNA repair protein RadD